METEEEPVVTKPRVERLPRSNPHDQTNDTFVIHKHDHTLGNSLRHMILKDPRTEFCGYSIIHPTEDNIHVRIQSKPEKGSSVEILKTGLENLKTAAQFVGMEYDDALQAFKNKTPRETQMS